MNILKVHRVCHQALPHQVIVVLPQGNVFPECLQLYVRRHQCDLNNRLLACEVLRRVAGELRVVTVEEMDLKV